MVYMSDSLLLDVGIFLTCILTLVYGYFKRSFTYWKNRNVPYIEPIFPFGNFGDTVLSWKSSADVFADIYNKLEGHKFGGMYILTRPRFIFRDPDLIKDVLVKDFSTFHDRGLYMNEQLEPLSGHLFLLPGTKWKNLRVKLTPTFTSGKMKLMFQRLADCGKELQLYFEKAGEKGDVVEMKDVLARFSTDVISSCAFGIECNCLKNIDAEFRQWGRKIFEPSLKRILIGILSGVAPVILHTLKIRSLDSNVSKYFLNMVKETVEYREKNNLKRNDFLQLLIRLKNKDLVEDEQKDEHQTGGINENNEAVEGMSMSCLAAQAFVFFLAGFETSSTTMTFCLYELAVNPDMQELLQTEIDTVLEKHDGNISYEAIQEMIYLDKVVAETLRKYPAVPMLVRECVKPYKIPGTETVLETGTQVLILLTGLHRDPKYYPEPDRFNPERFSEKEKQNRHHFVYLPFGEGPRNCIGMRFGLMQTKVGLVSLLSKYEISVSEKTPIPMVLDEKAFILAPRGGMWLRIKNRSFN